MRRSSNGFIMKVRRLHRERRGRLLRSRTRTSIRRVCRRCCHITTRLKCVGVLTQRRDRIAGLQAALQPVSVMALRHQPYPELRLRPQPVSRSTKRRPSPLMTVGTTLGPWSACDRCHLVVRSRSAGYRCIVRSAMLVHRQVISGHRRPTPRSRGRRIRSFSPIP